MKLYGKVFCCSCIAVDCTQRSNNISFDFLRLVANSCRICELADVSFEVLDCETIVYMQMVYSHATVTTGDVVLHYHFRLA